MKIVQILNDRVWWDATFVHPTLESTEGKYAPDIVFVEAPDYVFESWGWDGTKSGDERFIRPEAPEGWTYNVETGMFEEIEQAGQEDEAE